MSATRDAVNEAYKTAMKARDEVTVRTLRLLNSELKRFDVDERRAPTEAEVMQILQRSQKKRRETIDAARAQNRDDIVSAEVEELAVIEKFLPKQLDAAAVLAVVEAVLKESGATTKKEQGKVMQLAMAKLQGQADGKLVAKLVGERLQ